MFGMFFTAEDNISSFDQVMQCDSERFRKFFHGMLSNGVNFAPSPFETAFVSSAHGDKEIQATLQAAESVFKQL
jgi:glutamate-1-semialdehyde 2,1-aminomutase